MAEPADAVVGAALAVGFGLAVSSCFAVTVATMQDAGTGDSATRDAGLVPDAVFTVPYGAVPPWDSGGRDAGPAKDVASEDGGDDSGVVPDAVFAVPYGTAPEWDTGTGDARLSKDGARDAAARDTSTDVGYTCEPYCVPAYKPPPRRDG